jgi:hypothetical protein
MGVAEQQAALARLYVDPNIRERFRKDPYALCRELGLKASDAELLRSLAVDQVDSFARSLRRKRLCEVRKLLPRSCRALGDRYRPLFHDYAAGYLPTGIHRHSYDAAAFAGYLLKRMSSASLEPPWMAELIRFEKAVVKAALPDVWFHAVILRYDVSDPDEASIPPRRTCLHGWLRLQRGGRTRYFALRAHRSVLAQAADAFPL